MANSLREIIASFGVNVDLQNLKKGESAIGGFKETLTKLAITAGVAFGIHEVVEFTKGILESADVLAKQSIALSVSAAELQGWQFAAQLSGSSAEEFNSAFTKFNRNVAEASKGTGPAADALKALGVSTTDLKNSKPADLLNNVADGLVGMQDPAKRTQVIMDLFGRSGARLLPLFLEGSEGIKKLRDEVGELGASFDESFLQDAQEVNDNLDRMKLGFRGLAIQALKPILPLITSFSKHAVEMVKAIIPMIQQSSAVKTALIALGIAGAAALAPILWALTPIVLGFLALEDALSFLSGGDSLTGDLVNKVFGPGAASTVQSFFKRISEDFRLAGSDAFAFQQKWANAMADMDARQKQTFGGGVFAPYLDAYYATIKAMSGGFGTFVTFIVALAKGLNLSINAVWDDIYAAFNVMIAYIEDAFDGLWNKISRGGNRLAGNILSHIPGLEDIGKEILDAPAEGEGDFSTDNVAKAKEENRQRAYDRLKQAEGIAAQLGLGDQNLDARNVASSPVIGPPVAPTYVQPTYNTNIVQNIKADTPEELKRAASDGAKAGVGSHDRALRYLTPVSGQ